MVLQAAARLSKLWVPNGGIAATAAEDGHSKLIRAGFLRQSHSGIFHLLPLGRRVQDKVEGVVSRHMEESLSASRVSLSSISTEALWEKSGRLQNVASELFRFSDRKDVAYLLSPTHEEEITALVARAVKSYKELPLRLYQITRKYRDEFRPRHGLLRGREFTMKDLYTFDRSLDSATETYHSVRTAYSEIFSELKLPVLAAKASSGDMGGNLSHEYHLPMPLGEDQVVSCSKCDYAINEEIANVRVREEASPGAQLGIWRGISKDGSTLVNVWYPRSARQPGSADKIRDYSDKDINISAVRSIVPDLVVGVEGIQSLWSAALGSETRTATRLLNIVDGRLPLSLSDKIVGELGMSAWPEGLNLPEPPLAVSVHAGGGQEFGPLNLLRVRDGDRCSQCSSGTLNVRRAMELGHTFLLGTRYSEPLNAKITIPPSTSGIPMQMGCYGIGISRIIGAVAEHLADRRGLNWPIAIAPYSCVIVPAREHEGDALEVYQTVIRDLGTMEGQFDAIIDDRRATLPWKLTDADLIGFPLIVVLGREWRTGKRVEVQCRPLGIKEAVTISDLPQFIRNLYIQL
ncbi:hypothetical protein B0T26DRAFT_657110 [Lasiosphaeria miniovina]|uniref:proline--tRNA ligase n=1 Tax=Lasiosphaeria miniovina TaxID=1954250 RepID=A0AA39ZU97_9PEZI|nr:uncharacterized protein B0T26DRAFT_657110 [Lasiosphaeria miniovina]KAK0703844.1 hypothetical protein B0T26DRAFT_657110 [Lasiosphaeria miniovina]